MLQYWFTGSEERAAITVLDSATGKMHVADSDSHGNIKDIINAAIEGDERVFELFDVNKAVQFHYERFTDRITFRDDVVYVDNDPAPRAISDAIAKAYNEGGNTEALINFLDRLSNNPNADSREQLYSWLEATGGFTIYDDGTFVGYKGVEQVGDQLVSINSGKALVNGQETVGRIPNAEGNVIEMPRSEVTHNPQLGCHVGLHVGTWNFASRFGRGHVLEVQVDPADVVSVPYDAGASKMRVCRYKVVGVVEVPYTQQVYSTNQSNFDWTDWGELDYDLYGTTDTDIDDDYYVDYYGPYSFGGPVY